eukprot:TRINITY_DN7289_c0_g1_i5.p1 TRINITY_DN7289_c0_g1~~TRINITY_DN7289_c0_g1_i5.p1  ORF type:complete len:631 (-),score=76.94 TRINITY_DN7289_c0_g1_i5:102-1994(-)
MRTIENLLSFLFFLTNVLQVSWQVSRPYATTMVPTNVMHKLVRKTNGFLSKKFCNGRGDYINNLCECYTGFMGDKCQFTDTGMLDYYCNLRGAYNKQTDQCDCLDGYFGRNCENIYCDGNGIQLNDKCYCYAGYFGKNCQYSISKETCNNNGFSVSLSRGQVNSTDEIKALDQCLCYPFFYGENCQYKYGLKEFLNIENSNGNCPAGYTGRNCDISNRASTCNSKGFYEKETGTCICFEDFTGERCEYQRFSKGCNYRGYLVTLNAAQTGCLCDKNSYGTKCELVRCEGRGDFVKGTFCECQTNYAGENCETKIADKECNFNGISFTDIWGAQRCLCFQNGMSDDCKEVLEDKNSTAIPKKRTQRKTRSVRKFFRKLNNSQVMYKSEEGFRELEVYNAEMKAAADFLLSQKAAYEKKYEPLQDFFRGKSPQNIQTALDTYSDLYAKGNLPNPECNNNGHRLHIRAIDYEKLLSELYEEKIFQVEGRKYAVFLQNNKTIEDYVKERKQPLFERVICDCFTGWTGEYCEIQITKQKKTKKVEDINFQRNLKEILEKEEDIAVQNFEKYGEISMNTVGDSPTYSEKVEVLGVANENTRLTDLKELNIENEDSNSAKANKKLFKVWMLQELFGN